MNWPLGLSAKPNSMPDSTLECLVEDGVTVVLLGENYDNLDADTLKVDSDFLLETASAVDPPLLVLDMSYTKFFASEFLGRLFVRV